MADHLARSGAGSTSVPLSMGYKVANMTDSAVRSKNGRRFLYGQNDRIAAYIGDGRLSSYKWGLYLSK